MNATVDTIETAAVLSARWDNLEQDEWSRVLEYKGNKRVVLVAKSLTDDLYNGRRYALQSQDEPLGRYATEAIIHSAVTAAIWLTGEADLY